MNPSQVDGRGIDGEVIYVQMPSDHEAKMLVSTSKKKTREHLGRSFDVSIITLANLSKKTKLPLLNSSMMLIRIILGGL